MKEYMGREVLINGREGEIVDIIGVQYLKVQFFNMNDGECLIDVKDIDKYLV